MGLYAPGPLKAELAAGLLPTVDGHEMPFCRAGLGRGTEILAEDDATWRARLSAPTALGDSTFAFTFTLLERKPEEHVRITGHDRASQNVVDLTADLGLSETDGGPEVRWESDVRFGGVLASLGQRSLRYVVHKQVEDVFRKMEAQHSGVPA